jgi:hypothetical protein
MMALEYVRLFTDVWDSEVVTPEQIEVHEDKSFKEFPGNIFYDAIVPHRLAVSLNVRARVTETKQGWSINRVVFRPSATSDGQVVRIKEFVTPQGGYKLTSEWTIHTKFLKQFTNLWTSVILTAGSRWE